MSRVQFSHNYLLFIPFFYNLFLSLNINQLIQICSASDVSIEVTNIVTLCGYM